VAPGPAADGPAEVGVLEARGLTWRPLVRRGPTLAAVDLRLEPGERVLLAGASGSGKSTLLRTLAGLLDDTEGDLEGHVTLDGTDPQGRPGSVGLLLQDPRSGVVAEHAGRDAAFGPENRAQQPERVRDAAAGALDAVGFPYGADRATVALSGGEGARLALAGALALDPQVLLLDEPTAMLDPDSAARAVEAVLQAADGRTLVVAEHQLGPWLEVCDRLVVLDGGRVLADGPLGTVLRDQSAALEAAGVWVPGAPDPEPLPVVLPAAPRPDVGLRWEALDVVAPDGAVLATDAAGGVPGGGGLAVVGPSGAGKSTLLRVLAGLDRPRGGRVEVRAPDGWTPLAEVAQSSAGLARRVGWAPQDSESAFTARTVLDEARATGEVLHAADPAARDAAHARADLLLDALGLAALRDESPYALSGGEQRRLVLVAALAHDPGLLLLDEPTVGQDRRTWAAVAGVLDAVRASGAAVVATTHDPRLAARLGVRLPLTGRGAPEHAAAGPDHRLAPVVEPGTPPAGLCNPLTLLLVAVLAAVGSFGVDTALVGVLTLAASALLAPLALRRGQLRAVLVRLAPVGFAALSVGWSTLLLNAAGPFSPGSGAVAGREVVRVLCLVVPGALLVGLLRPSSLGDALGQRLHLPARPVVAATAALLRLDDFSRTWRRMAETRHVRGLAPGRSVAGRVRQAWSLTIGLLVQAFRAAQLLSVAMDARGFAAVHRRTYALPSTFGRRDAVALLAGCVLLVLPTVLGRVLPG
jgi:energy-coupling factor transport system permease/ATP-binding protein